MSKRADDVAARRIAEKYVDLVKDTKVFTSGCTVCGDKGHRAADHD